MANEVRRGSQDHGVWVKVLESVLTAKPPGEQNGESDFIKLDPEFEPKMAAVLHVYKEVEIVNAELVQGTLKEPPVVTISYDERPGIQALATTTPDLPPAPNRFPSHLRDHEYTRLGTVSLLAGLDLHTGRVTEIVSDHHASADFIALLSKLHEGYPPQTRIRLLLDNHSAHISKESRGWLSLHPQRFEFVFTTKHGSWLNWGDSSIGTETYAKRGMTPHWAAPSR